MRHVCTLVCFAFFSALLCGCAGEEPGVLTSPGIISNPECVNAWNTVDQAGGTDALRTLVGNRCEIIYEKGWAEGTGISDPALCDPAWTTLESAGLLGETRTLVTEDCPILCGRIGLCGTKSAFRLEEHP